MKTMIIQMLLLLLMSAFCIFTGIREPIRSEFSDQMFFFGALDFLLIFFVWGSHYDMKEYEETVKKFY